jgi:hypothetical protein
MDKQPINALFLKKKDTGRNKGSFGIHPPPMKRYHAYESIFYVFYVSMC